MLLTEFDSQKQAVINPDMLHSKIPGFPKVTVSCFSRQLFQRLLSFLGEPIQIGESHCAFAIIPIYEVIYKDCRFAFFQSCVGEPTCVSTYEDIIAMGSKRLILFGNCGVLEKTIEDCGIIIPTSAIRDEGCSYHYAPASDTIPINKKYVNLFKDILRERGYPYTEGVTWTTDAPYRETRDIIARRKAQGAICVEMECAGMQALCDFRETEFFQFLYAGDNLDHTDWDRRSISGDVRLNDKEKIGLLAFELGLKIMEIYDREK